MDRLGNGPTIEAWNVEGELWYIWGSVEAI